MVQILANKSNYGGKRSTSSIKYIVIHYTANDGDSAKGNGNYFKNNNVEASAHYFVDDKDIVQSVPDNYVAWSVGGKKWNNNGGRLYGIATNNNTLNIELCDTQKNGTIAATTATIENALSLVRQKMSEYGIDKNHVIRHYDVTGKSCPAYWVNDDRWRNEFWNKIDQWVPAPQKPTITDHIPYGVSRMYNPNSGEHFFTVSESERDILYNGGWAYEGVSWISASIGGDGDMVNRFYNPANGAHFFTADNNEKQVLKILGWKDEGIAFISDPEKHIPIYRMYHNGFHHYTPSTVEKDLLIKEGWSYEGIAFYGTALK